MVKFRKILCAVLIAVVLFFIYFPIVFLSVNSFNKNDEIQRWTGFSFAHYRYFFASGSEPKKVVLQTILLALVVATLSTVLGTIGAIGLYASKKRLSKTINAVNQIPVINAEVVTAISFALLIVFLGIDKNTYIPLVLGQMVLCTPFVVLSVLPKLKQMDGSLYEAALDLGASPTKALFSVILPQILPGVLAGFLLSITLSLDDYVIAAYTKPDSFKTISTHIYGLDKNNNIGPKIKASYRAFTAIVFLLIVLLVIASNVIPKIKKEKKRK